MATPGSTPRERRVLAQQAADAHGGVASRTLLRAIGITYAHVRAEVAADRWARHGDETVAVHVRELSATEDRWRAIWEVGRRIAVLDGVTSLQASGLTGFDDDRVHVSVPHTARITSVPGVRPHKITARLPDEVMSTGIPRVRPPVAALRAAHWALSDRQAALILVMVVQQRLVTPDQLALAAATVKGRRRRAFVAAVVRDITDGIHSLGELDFARLCRERGMPEPDRQVVRRGPKGRIYLDVRWRDYALVVEIDGAQHRIGLAVTEDNLRANSLTIRGDTFLRIDVVGLRIETSTFLDQVSAGLRSLGWTD